MPRRKQRQPQAQGSLIPLTEGERVTTWPKGAHDGTVQEVDRKGRFAWVAWDGDVVPPNWYALTSLRRIA